MKAPTIHLNGTSADELLEQIAEASRACHALNGALTNAMPNARDYYVQGDGAFEVARREWDARRQAVDKVRRELEEIADAIWEQKR